MIGGFAFLSKIVLPGVYEVSKQETFLITQETPADDEIPSIS
jgi:hypothetical protein